MSARNKSLIGRLSKKILVYVNVVVALALAISYFSVHISPQKFWPVAFFGLAFPYLFTLNLVFVLFWLAQKKIYFLISFVTLVAGWNHITHSIQIPWSNDKNKMGQEPSFKAMTYNVRMFDYFRWSEEKGSANKMIEFLQKEKPDILCLQEFYIPKSNEYITLKSVKEGLGWLKYQHIDYINNFMGGTYGVATFSRYPILKKGSQEFKNSVNRVIFTDVLIGNDTIRIFNNHLQSFRLKNNNFRFINNIKLEYTDDQLREAKDLSKKLRNAYIIRSKQVDIVSDMIKNAPYNVLVCGDFNDTPVSYTYKTMRGDLKDSFITSGRGISNTYHGRAPQFRIDYIFHSKSFNSANYRRHKVKYSDHYPVSTIIHLDD